jgi:hypothetical protein
VCVQGTERSLQDRCTLPGVSKKCPCKATGARFTGVICCFKPGPQDPYRGIFLNALYSSTNFIFKMITFSIFLCSSSAAEISPVPRIANQARAYIPVA